MKRFILYVMGVNFKGVETQWFDVNSYGTRRAAKQGLDDLRKNNSHTNKWKLIDRVDNSVSFF